MNKRKRSRQKTERSQPLLTLTVPDHVRRHTPLFEQEVANLKRLANIVLKDRKKTKAVCIQHRGITVELIKKEETA